MSFNDKGLNCITSTLLSAGQQWRETSREVYIKLSETIAKGQKKKTQQLWRMHMYVFYDIIYALFVKQVAYVMIKKK